MREEETKLFGLFWKLFALVLCVLIISAASCTAYQANRTYKMVELGYSPLEAACAFTTNSASVTCVVQAGRK